MRNFVFALILLGAGFCFGWLFASMYPRHGEFAHGVAGDALSTAGSRVGTDINASSERTVPRDPEQPAVAAATDPGEPTRSSSAVLVKSLDTGSNLVGIRQSLETSTTDVDGKAAAPWERPSAQPERLLEATSITCEFGAGLTGSVRSLPSTRFNYQGSPIGFDTFDTAAGTARMTGNIAGSTNETKVRIDASAGALHFSGKLPSGNFVLITVFGLLANDLRSYAAIMTMHNHSPTGLHTQINSGNCY